MPRKKRIIILTLIVVCIICLIFALYLNINKNTEKNNELADLELMSIAKSQCDIALENGSIHNGDEFYYDADSYSITSTKPDAYGYGTSLKGNGIKYFESDKDFKFEYDESKDYTNSVLKIKIVDNKVNVKWVE